MRLNNPLYKNIGIHVLNSIFTVDNGVMKVLLIQRTHEPYKGKWALPGGCLYNNELVVDGAKRELKEKADVENVELKMYKVFDRLDRSPVRRMIAIAFIGIIDKNQAKIHKITSKSSNSDWFDIKNVPDLAYDHNEIIAGAFDELKVMIQQTDILKSLFPDEFTLPELQQVFESILDKTFDRRNFRKKLIKDKYIIDTNKSINFKGKKPAKLYRLNKDIKSKSIF